MAVRNWPDIERWNNSCYELIYDPSGDFRPGARFRYSELVLNVAATAAAFEGCVFRHLLSQKEYLIVNGALKAKEDNGAEAGLIRQIRTRPDNEQHLCPYCGSPRTVRHGIRRNKGHNRQRMRCRDCDRDFSR